MQAVGTKNRTSLHSIDGSAFKTRGSLSIGRGGHVRKRRRGSLSFGISSLGGATFFQDTELRKQFLKSGEWAGFTVSSKNSCHYLLAEYVPVGEAITLAMRTAVPWYN